MAVPTLHLPHLRLGGVVGAVNARRESSRRRAVADEWLIWGARPQSASPLLAARAAELTSAKTRHQFAALARRIIAEQSEPRCRAYAVNRPAIRHHIELFVALAERLESAEPVDVQGMARAARLLSDGGGPLYDPQQAEELGPTLARAVRELDPCS
jgi:hypothetical protein